MKHYWPGTTGDTANGHNLTFFALSPCCRVATSGISPYATLWYDSVLAR
ncbi:MAG: hypothetical protein IPL78_35875 [Chloroflexi bacterium]|nr:hypothetical protein [Chloroflexota bacterium]